jgi:DNA primase
MIPRDFIDALLARADIVEVIDRRVPLKRAGANFMACCPFHQEKSPSFSVSPTKQFYHCFGCGAHGTAISFLMSHLGLGFVDAVKLLAEECGMTVPQDAASTGPSVDFAGLQSLLERAQEFYRAQLKLSPTAVDYLKSRGLTGEVAAHFGLGYAPKGRDALKQVFDDYADARLVEVGLLVEAEGQRRDKFRDRIMFPIHDHQGRLVGFGGRVLGQGEPKYLNSPETPLFRKGQELYHLHQARPAIRAARRVMVVEGYMDVVALAQYGIDYAVATLGTATTPVQAQRLLRTGAQVVFCFDGDAAGRKAAWRALENAMEVLTDTSEVHFMFLPEDEDPDSFVRARGVETLERMLGEAEPLSRFLLRELAARHDMDSAEGRARMLHAAQPLLARLSAPALKLTLRSEIASLARVRDEDVIAQPAPSNRAGARSISPPRLRQGATSQVRLALRALLNQPSLARDWAGGDPWGAGPEADALRLVLESARAEASITTYAQIAERVRGHALEPLLRQALGDLGDADWDYAEDFNAAARRLAELESSRRRLELSQSGLDGLGADAHEQLLRPPETDGNPNE